MEDHEIQPCNGETTSEKMEAVSMQTGKRGRRKANVFGKPGSGKGALPPNLYRLQYLGRLNIWTDAYPKRIRWWRRRYEGDPDWQLCKAAELAMVVMGRKSPERIDKKPFHRQNLLSFDQEALLFVSWLRNELENNRDRVRGPRPDFLRTWKTAVSLAVARYVVTKKGQHYSVPPSPREIAQIWFLLFGEEEPYDSIKSRLPTVASLCKRFAEDGCVLTSQGKREYFRKAGDCILRKLTPK